jgi:hypothetical protein
MFLPYLFVSEGSYLCHRHFAKSQCDGKFLLKAAVKMCLEKIQHLSLYVKSGPQKCEVIVSVLGSASAFNDLE